MHWADHAAKILSQRGVKQTIASGITPSGSFHIGHLREILTAEMIHRACQDIGLESRYVFIVDSMDPLRRVYSFLHEDYNEYIGHPLAFIPAPNPDGKPDSSLGSYSDHFLKPFLAALHVIGVSPEIVMNHEVYASGAMESRIHEAITKRLEIKDVIESISGRELAGDWFPYNPLGSDGGFDGVRVVGYERPYVHWIDEQGVRGKSDIREAQGKMPWRVDWSARWGLHEITCEPAGKDHGAAGGSYDTGIPISRILGYEPPAKMVYEWIQIKGGGPMSSSAGNTIGPIETLEIVPPEIVRYLVARTKMSKHIDFDTGNMLFEIADEYERLASNPPTLDPDSPRRKQVAAETALGALRMSQIKTAQDLGQNQVPFRHLSMLAQIRSADHEIWSSLSRSGHIKGEPDGALRTRLKKMRNWIESDHFPEDHRVRISTKVPEKLLGEMSDSQVEFLRSLATSLTTSEWSEPAIGSAIVATMDESAASRRECYTAIYLALIGQERGPKISTLIAECDRNSIVNLFSLS
ncbi:MAG: lysine--tRNA ligase [Candidatus Poseidoniales archaeon]|nr:MAG: lysine--tRNA ligase [Candidatus Poseidoniales archaeon]